VRWRTVARSNGALRMPLDMGRLDDASIREPLAGAGVEPVVTSYVKTLGDELRAAREARGLSLTDMADRTKVRRAYLAAIEDMRMEALPSRPFAIGYVRSYAEALDLDPDALVARFRQESPEQDASLRAPSGLAFQSDGRFGLIAAGVGALVAAVVVWNLAQRVFMPAEARAVAAAPAEAQQALADLPPPRSVIRIGAPTPPPAEQTVPAAYITPGLEAAYAAANGIILTADGAVPAPTPAAELSATPVAFEPKGVVYGSEADRATVILQARKPANIVVRDAAGHIHFARQLAAGEAYRAPATPGLTADLSDPLAFDLFRDGQLQAALAETSVSLDRLARVSAR
jgi:cytoskeleton protein RodZ